MQILLSSYVRACSHQVCAVTHLQVVEYCDCCLVNDTKRTEFMKLLVVRVLASNFKLEGDLKVIWQAFWTSSVQHVLI